MNTIEQLKAKHAQELAELEKETSIAESLPLPASLICQHKEYTAVQYGKKFPDRYTMKEAVEIYSLFASDVVEAEHWRSGCLSVCPVEINNYAKEERAVMDGASHAELKLEKGKGYDAHALIFWARVAGNLLKVEIELRPEWKWLPQVDTHYDRHGNVISNCVQPVGIGEDQFRKWGGSDSGYRLSYYWANMENFHSWLSSQNIFVGRFAENN